MLPCEFATKATSGGALSRPRTAMPYTPAVSPSVDAPGNISFTPVIIDPVQLPGPSLIVAEAGIHGHIERTVVGPHATGRIKIEGSEKASLRSMRLLLALHPVGERILYAAREAAVDDFLSDAAVAATVSLPPSKEAALELRELFARGHCLR